MEIACGVLALTLVLLAGALLGATRRRKESSELVEELRSLFQPRPLIERARIRRDASLPGYAISLKLRNHGAVPMDIIEAYAISRFNDGEECGTRWYPTKKRLRSLEPGRTTTIRFAIESRKAQRIKWPSSVKVGVRIRRGLQDHLETWGNLRVAIDPGSVRKASLIDESLTAHSTPLNRRRTHASC